jgi:RHS repeat-associated protein
LLRLLAGQTYVVAASLGSEAGALWAYRKGAAGTSSFTTPDGSITVTGSTYCRGSACVPSAAKSSYAMYGMVDIGAVPAVTSSRQTYFYYDGDQQRVLKSVPRACGTNGRIIYYFGPYVELDRQDPWRASEQRDLYRYIMLGKQRVAVAVSDGQDRETLFLHSDPLGSVTLTTDQRGDLRRLREYEPFGRVARELNTSPARPVRYGFAGLEEDSQEQLLHMGVRQYSPALARVMMPDRFVGDLANPQSLNRYSYGNNNPVKYTDRSGYFGLCETCNEVQLQAANSLYNANPAVYGRILGLAIAGGLTLTVSIPVVLETAALAKLGLVGIAAEAGGDFLQFAAAMVELGATQHPMATVEAAAAFGDLITGPGLGAELGSVSRMNRKGTTDSFGLELNLRVGDTGGAPKGAPVAGTGRKAGRAFKAKVQKGQAGPPRKVGKKPVKKSDAPKEAGRSNYYPLSNGPYFNFRTYE